MVSTIDYAVAVKKMVLGEVGIKICTKIGSEVCIVWSKAGHKLSSSSDSLLCLNSNVATMEAFVEVIGNIDHYSWVVNFVWVGDTV